MNPLPMRSMAALLNALLAAGGFLINADADVFEVGVLTEEDCELLLAWTFVFMEFIIDLEEVSTRYIKAFAVKRVIWVPRAISDWPCFSASRSNNAPITPKI